MRRTERPQTIAEIITNLFQSDFSETEVKHCRDTIDRAWYLCEERNGGYHPTAQELYGLLNFLNERIIPAIRSESHDNESARKWLEQYVEDNLGAETSGYIIEHRQFSEPSVDMNEIGTM
ncbi:MAG: hypothetical protein ACOC38_06540 [Promethearchaeia archaeon]